MTGRESFERLMLNNEAWANLLGQEWSPDWIAFAMREVAKQLDELPSGMWKIDPEILKAQFVVTPVPRHCEGCDGACG